MLAVKYACAYRARCRFGFYTQGQRVSGWIATLAGWYTTEIGRQPWLVQGVLSTKDAVSDVPAGMVLSTLIGYLVIYGILILAYMGVITYLARKATNGDPYSTRSYPRGREANVSALQPGE